MAPFIAGITNLFSTWGEIYKSNQVSVIRPANKHAANILDQATSNQASTQWSTALENPGLGYFVTLEIKTRSKHLLEIIHHFFNKYRFKAKDNLAFAFYGLTEKCKVIPIERDAFSKPTHQNKIKVPVLLPLLQISSRDQLLAYTTKKELAEAVCSLLSLLYRQKSLQSLKIIIKK